MTRFVALLLALSLAPAHAATWYVATTGNDTTGTGSAMLPWRTIGRGIAGMGGGDTLVVRAGVYADQPNFINTLLHPIPNGSAAAFTRIVAEQAYAVRIRNTVALGYDDSIVGLETGTRYVQVDGFVFEISDSEFPPFIAKVDGDHNKITRTIYRRAGVTDEYGGWVRIGGDDNLFEDCAGVGSARYGFSLGGPTSTAQRNIFRRCVGRVDYSTSDQPKATFSMYGNDAAATNVRDVLLQNCIAVDSRKGRETAEPTYGGFLFPKNVAGATVQGSIVLNVEAAYAGFFLREQQARDLKIENSVAWGGYGGASVAGVRGNSSAVGFFTIDHVTVGAYPRGYYNDESFSTRTMRNTLFLGNAQLASSNSGWTTQTTNAFSPAAQAQGTNPIVVASNVLKHIVRAEAGSALSGVATDGGDVGANVTRRYGVSGTLWGEPGFDQPTAEPLWPWPNEDPIKLVFAEPNAPPAGAVPATNDTTRGFCVANDAFGKPMTLTRYVWQYLGNEIPAGIYVDVFGDGFE